MAPQDTAPHTPTENGDIERLKRLLDTPETAWLLSRMRARLESTGRLEGFLSKAIASGAERSAAARLVGLPVRAGTSASVPLGVLDETLRRTGVWPAGLASAVVALTGTVIDPVSRSADQAAWRQANHTLHTLAGRRESLAPWVDMVIRTGAFKRAVPEADDADLFADLLVSIADALPSDAESLGAFAARVAGDPNAFERGTDLGALAAGLAFHLGGSSSEAATGTARWFRDSWTSVGIVVDDLTSTVLTFGLPGGISSPTARALAAMTAAGQPMVLTLKQLAEEHVGNAPPVALVCESPALIGAAASSTSPGQRGSGAALVCLGGQPGAAAVRLLKALRLGGSEIRYHGNFDWAGITAAQALTRHVAWVPWRFAEVDYLAACAASDDLPLLRGAAVETPWDPALSDSMALSRRGVEEELVIRHLLDDLTVVR